MFYTTLLTIFCQKCISLIQVRYMFMTIKIETEAKIKIHYSTFKRLKNRLGTSEFFKQTNYYFQNSLDEIIRLRCENNQVILNRKTKIENCSEFKSEKEEEILISINDPEKLLSYLGFERIFCYTKERANFNLNNCIISLDKLENQYFIEIEGKENDIETVIDELEMRNECFEKRS